MDTLEFLQRVLPTGGYYATAIINPDRPVQHGFFTSITELAKACVASDTHGNNTYYAIATFTRKGHRTQDNADTIRSFILDIDCGPGKPYPSWKEGLQALGAFVATAGFPKPLVVHSGIGLHVYWPMTEALPATEWAEMAQRLKTAVLQHGFKLDIGLTANSAVVLRPIGTHNPKNGREVRLLIDAPDVPVDTMRAVLGAYAPHKPSVVPRSKAPTSKLSAAMAIPTDLPPAVAGLVVSKCQQIRWGVEHQEEVSEPFWYAMMGVAAYCENPEEAAIAWSDQYSGYSKEETLAKMRQWREASDGPATCAKFEELRPGGCDGCKYHGKIGTPARLGVRYKEAPADTSAPAPAEIEVPMPKGFRRTDAGIKIVIDEADVDVCPFDVYPASYGRDESLGYEVVRYYWNRPHSGWQELSFRQADLTRARLKDFTTGIADQGIVLPTEKQTEYFQIMLRSYMDELRRQRSMTNLYATMGWKEDFTQFVIGDTVLQRQTDGTVTQRDTVLASTSQRLGDTLWQTAGTLQNWVEFTRLLDRTNLHAHMFALGVSLSAPLYAFTGLHGLTISLYGPTGGGKTLAQYWQQSVWGNPGKLHFAAKFTQNTLFSRMGLYCHLPMTVDEATMVSDKEVGDFLYWVSQGRDKARMSRAAEEREARTWATPTTISTNRSWQAKLIASGLDTDAQAARLLELAVPVHRMFSRTSEAGKRIYMFLHTNYGMVGREFLRRLLELGPDGIQAAIAEATASFNKRYKSRFAGAERYWEQAIVLADLALRLASDWGLIQFKPVVGVEWALSQIGAIRRAVTDNQLDAFDMLSEYLAENVDKQVQVYHLGSGKPVIDFNRLPRSEVRVRFDFYRPKHAAPIARGVLMVDRTHFRRWISSQGGDYQTFTRTLEDEGVLLNIKHDKAYLAKDTPLKLGQAYVFGVNLSHPRTLGLLTDADSALDDTEFATLRAVS